MDINAFLDTLMNPEFINSMVAYGLRIVGAIVILIVGRIVAGMVKKAILKIFKRSEALDETLGHFFSGLAYYLIIAFVVIAVLQQFGVQTASLIALLGAVGLAIGLAMQGTLGNIAAGVMLLLFRPFKIGDYIEAGGTAGSVRSVGLFVTEVATPDNVQILLPNSLIWGDTITNYSAHPTRRVDIDFGVGYGVDLDKAMAVVRQTIEADTRVHKDPEVLVAITNLGDYAVTITTRSWAKASDYWGLKFDLTKRVKEALDREGLDIPFPTTTILQAAS
ncbi:MAG: mechanosensitive ion channel domain-containing protein [Pseudomonadota bacterium]